MGLAKKTKPGWDETSETKQTEGSDRPCAILPHLVALQQKRGDLKGCRLSRNKAWSVAKRQSRKPRGGAEQTREEIQHLVWTRSMPCFSNTRFYGLVFSSAAALVLKLQFYLAWRPLGCEFPWGCASGAEAGRGLEPRGPQAWGRKGKKQGLIINVGVRPVESSGHIKQEERGRRLFQHVKSVKEDLMFNERFNLSFLLKSELWGRQKSPRM